MNSFTRLPLALLIVKKQLFFPSHLPITARVEQTSYIRNKNKCYALKIHNSVFINLQTLVADPNEI